MQERVLMGGGGGGGAGGGTVILVASPPAASPGPSPKPVDLTDPRASRSSRRTRFALRLALLRAGVFLLAMRLIESVTRLAAVMDTARAAEGVEVVSLLVAAGWSATLISNMDYLRGSPYLRPIEQAVGAPLLLTLFLCLCGLLVSNILLRRRVASPLTNWPVYLLRILGFMVSGGTWAFVGWMNNASLLTVGAGTVSPLTPLFAGLVVACALCAVSVADRFIRERQEDGQGQGHKGAPPGAALPA